MTARARATHRVIPSATLLVVTLLAGCGSPASDEPARQDPGTTASMPPAHPVPESAPNRFGFGVPADSPRIARWDGDVAPDGVGLPDGSGTVDRGADVWVARCAACHGATGVEGPFNALVGGAWPRGTFPEGRTVGSYWPYATTLYDYIRRAMPQESPGSLSADDTYAVIAWVLHRNGIVEADAVLDAESLPRVVMPAHDRFVPDDRTGGRSIR